MNPPGGGSGDDGSGDDVDLGSGPPVCASLPVPPILPAPSGITSGTRLVQRTLAEAVPGGLEIPWSVHDVLLDIDCAPTRVADGTLRCYPTGADLHSGPEQFADAALTIPIFVVSRAVAPPAGGLVVTGSFTDDPFDGLVSCHRAPSTGRWRRGAARADTVYYTRAGGPPTIVASTFFDVFGLIPEPTDFVELQEVRTHLTGAIALRELHGADGSRVFASKLYDTAHDVSVSLTTSPTDLTTRLLPPMVSEVAAYFHRPKSCASSEQSRDPIFKPLASIDCDGSALRFATDAANNDLVFQVAYTAGSTLYQCAGGANDVAPVAFNDPLLGGCRPSALSDWASAALTPAPGVRLTGRIWKVGDAALPLPLTSLAPLAAPKTFTDTALGFDCRTRTAADGALRCLPIEVAEIVFSDAGCTTQVAAPQDAAAPLYAASPANPLTRLDVPTTLFQIGAQRSTAQLYVTGSTGCQPFRTDVSYELGAEVDPTTFAALELRNAPTAPAP
jgi:hypothetical protein